MQLLSQLEQTRRIPAEGELTSRWLGKFGYDFKFYARSQDGEHRFERREAKDEVRARKVMAASLR